MKVSGDDLAYMAPDRPTIDAARDLLGLGARVVLLTDGARAVRILGRDFELELPVPRVAVVDTVGSGDAFGGAFLTWWVERGLGRAGLADQAAVSEAATRGHRGRQSHLPASRSRPAHTYRGRLARPVTGPGP